MKSPFAGSGLAIGAGVKHVVGIQYVSFVRDNVVTTCRMISSGGGEKGSQEHYAQTFKVMLLRWVVLGWVGLGWVGIARGRTCRRPDGCGVGVSSIMPGQGVNSAG